MTVHGDVISHVNISAVRVEDGGEYRCSAVNRVARAHHAARLNIYGLPHVRTMGNYAAVAGETTVIKCPVAGFPIASITWEKGSPLCQSRFPTAPFLPQETRRYVFFISPKNISLARLIKILFGRWSSVVRCSRERFYISGFLNAVSICIYLSITFDFSLRRKNSSSK